MKKILLASLVLVSASVVKAQKGSVLLYGDLGLSTQKAAGDQKVTSFDINPGVGFYLNNNWALGVNLGFSTQKNEFTTPTTKNNSFLAGPFLRYSKDLSNTFYFFSQLNASYVYSKQESGSTEVKTNGFNVGVVPAVGINLNKGFGLNFSIGGIDFNTAKVKGASSSSNSFDLNFGRTVNIGVQKVFGKK